MTVALIFIILDIYNLFYTIIKNVASIKLAYNRNVKELAIISILIKQSTYITRIYVEED